MTPNSLAWIALAGWPAVVIVFFAVRRGRCPIARTTAWMMFLPVMFLPSSLLLKVPGVPGFNKHRIASLALTAALVLFHGQTVWRKSRPFQFPFILFPAMLYAIVQTIQTNGDALTFGPNVIPGLTSHDIWSTLAWALLDTGLPFAVGQLVFRTERDLRDLFEVLSTCALIYAPLCLIEVRLSPQLHGWVYGFSPSSFAFVQSIRAGGYRPIVFMNHGLSVAMFMFTCFCAALALHLGGSRTAHLSPTWRMSITGVLIVLCKSLGAFIYALAAFFLMKFLSGKMRARVIAILAIIVLAFPVMRASNVFPTRGLVDLFARISPDRAESLQFRFDNEDRLLARAMERPLFGWGTFGRERVYSSWGQDLTVQDGTWIVLLGEFGYAGFLGTFALMVVPVARFLRNRSRLAPTAQRLLGTLAVMVALMTIDLLPNSRSDQLGVMYAGALYALSGSLRRSRAAGKREVPAGDPCPTLAVQESVR